MQFSLGMVDAVKVQFLKQICGDDFPEKGMKAWLVDIKKDIDSECYKLYFDFTEFEAENEKYFKEVYYPNKYTKEHGVNKEFYTAKEAGMYKPKYSVYFGDINYTEHELDEELSKYLKIVE